MGNEQVKRDLERLYPGQDCGQRYQEYYSKKKKRSICIVIVGTILALVLGIKGAGSQWKGNHEIARGAFGEEEEWVALECYTPEGKWTYEMEVFAEMYDGLEITQIYNVFSEELPNLILGENVSLQEVCLPLDLKEYYQGYPFTVEWKSGDTMVLHHDGSIDGSCRQQVQVPLRAMITYGGQEWEEMYTVGIVPPELSQEEAFYLSLEEQLVVSEEESRTETFWTLPDNWQGQSLEWRKQKDATPLLLWMGTLGVAGVIYFLADRDLHAEVEKRRQCIKRSYPDVLHKLVLYMGAGMTIRGAFQRIGEEQNGQAVQEEIVYMCRELQTGISESAAYEHFGRRTGLQEYIRLSTLLTQNLKKGNSTLLERLREEADRSSEERINESRRLGEEASIKLLLPMVMMLLVIMLIIMIPAFSSVGT